ncbi:class I SAM-dependent methyltransferase [Vagococcus sp. BWB3-3]|uniref:Class I SAM-dependent methyltransferase n=1 Tax=Vagococcus allomyrinae TaxID=2794353 RepID=A0A940P688_9ENTE|nr:class I SAM-dependent methyltransferase [Vagococcus allomyrinae]MBP1042172.1 class I SAM-dependent methyltransferase [Vagococcus allomyrinae]
MTNHYKNVERFSGFADLYEDVRPSFPEEAIALACSDLRRKPAVVVDLGSGTGLSTRAWSDHAQLVIGVEPNEEMLEVAEKQRIANVEYQRALAHDTGLQTGCADIVSCAQSFHWMEPHTTLQEINRLLTHDGLFITIDNEWPPVSDWQAEKLYQTLFSKVNHLELTEPNLRDKQRRWAKENHLINLSRSGYFRFTRQVLLSKTEIGDADRFIKLALSQGGIQNILKYQPDLIVDELAEFEHSVKDLFGGQPRQFYFSYRANIGVK